MKKHMMIVFDLEWNGGWGKVKLNEVLQIGAVKLARLGGPVVDSFRAFVKPVVHKKLNRAAKGLAFSAGELEQGDSFAAVLERFLTWCGEDYVLASWGGNDLRELQANADFWKLKLNLPRTALDLQVAAGRAAGTKNDVALSAMAEYFGLPDSLEPHDALNDAFYAALVGEMAVLLCGEEVLHNCTRPGLSAPLRDLRPYVIHTGPRCGGFPQEQDALSSRGVRRQHCPQCGKPLCIASWFPLEDQSYLTQVPCPEHGPQFFWASMSRSEGGLWRGKVRTLRVSPAVQTLYSDRNMDRAIPCRTSRQSQKAAATASPPHEASCRLA